MPMNQTAVVELPLADTILKLCFDWSHIPYAFYVITWLLRACGGKIFVPGLKLEWPLAPVLKEMQATSARWKCNVNFHKILCQ